jgi:hypothetical protein
LGGVTETSGERCLAPPRSGVCLAPISQNQAPISQSPGVPSPHSSINSSVQRRLFVADSRDGKNLKLRVFQSERGGDEKAAVSELARRLNIPPENITVHNYINIFPFEADNQSEERFSVYEEA